MPPHPAAPPSPRLAFPLSFSVAVSWVGRDRRARRNARGRPGAPALPTLALGLLLALGAATLATASTAGAETDASTATLPRRRAIEDAMRRANAYYQANFAPGSAVWNRGAYHGGNLRAWEVLRLPADLAYTLRWCEANNWTVGPEAGGGADADSQTCGQPYLDLHALDPQPVRKASIKTRLDLLVANPAADDDWWWIDAFYMAGPTLARLARVENDPAYFTQAEQMYAHMKSGHGLFDPARGLWYRDNTAKNRTGSFTPQFWGRGNGWVIAGCARMLEQLPAGDPRRAEFESMLQTMAAALLPLQGVDGFWRSNLLFPEQHPNPETSCTAFFAYAMAYGINEGLLDSATYLPAVERAWDGMVSTALNSAGRLGYVQAIGAAPAPNNAEGSQDYGYGAFLLTGCELLRMLGGPAPVSAVAGPGQTVTDADGDFSETVRLDASGTVLRDASALPRYTWWRGPVLLGMGEQLDVELPLGEHPIPLMVEHGDTGPAYTDGTTVRVNPPPASRPAATAVGHQIPNTPANVLDGDLSTRWSQEGDGQWLQVALPLVATLDHVDLAFYQGDTRVTFFDLQLSTDGVTWATVYSGSGGGGGNGLERFAFAPRAARYVRYVGHGNSQSAWNSVTELALPVAELLDSADTDANGLPDSWEISRFGAIGQAAAELLPAYVAGAAPAGGDAADMIDGLFRIEVSDTPGMLRLVLESRAALGPGYVGKTRRYRVLTSPDLAAGSWQPLAGREPIDADNLAHAIPVTLPARAAFYRAEAWLE